MVTQQQAATMDALRNAAAKGTLLVITGAGVSKTLLRKDGRSLPNWGELVQSLYKQARLSKLSTDQRKFLDSLLPNRKLLSKVNGDVLIEAAEILQTGFKKGAFERAVAYLCREKSRTCTDIHEAIASIHPVGVITFNYDCGHEEGFRRAKLPFEVIKYSERDKLKSRLTAEKSNLFVLKAHGCISDSSSLVLTSSSYHDVLSNNRAYRLFLQHCLVKYSVLISGFGLRDRDFDQLLRTLEIEIGKSSNCHAFIDRRPDTATDEGKLRRAELAAVTARFGLNPLYVDDFADTAKMILSIGEVPGSLIQNLVNECMSKIGSVRARAHDEILGLGKIGRSQVRRALLNALGKRGMDLETRSELIYAFRGIIDGDMAVALRLATEVTNAATAGQRSKRREHGECAAHALIVLRGVRVTDKASLRSLLGTLRDPALLTKLAAIDLQMDIPRLRGYAEAAAAEIESRSIALK